MRALAFILASYILALAFVPGADDPSVHDEGDNHSVVLADVGSPCGDHHHNPGDACSPLCFCHCCDTHMHFFESDIFFSSLEFTPSCNDYFGRITSSVVTPPLQPPAGIVQLLCRLGLQSFLLN